VAQELLDSTVIGGFKRPGVVDCAVGEDGKPEVDQELLVWPEAGSQASPDGCFGINVRSGPAESWPGE
jgi:hypothetical protein